MTVRTLLLFVQQVTALFSAADPIALVLPPTTVLGTLWLLTWRHLNARIQEAEKQARATVVGTQAMYTAQGLELDKVAAGVTELLRTRDETLRAFQRFRDDCSQDIGRLEGRLDAHIDGAHG